MSDDDRVTTSPGEGPPRGPVERGRGDIVDGRYRLEHFLSSGGMGRVWQASDLDLHREVAIKLMHRSLVATQNARARFLREAQAAARLTNARVVKIHDVKVESERGVPYLTMELLRGEDLARRLERGPLSYAQTVEIMTDVCAAITEAHAKQIVHRDLKPGNIFLLEGPGEVRAKVLDFGIVKSRFGNSTPSQEGAALTIPGAALGTVSYMSPEQAEDATEVDHRADLWSLSVVIFECLTGKRAFRAKNPAELGRELAGPRVVPSNIADDLPPGFDAWFARGTHRELSRRFSSARHLLESFIALGKVAAAPVSRPESSAPAKAPSRSWASDANQIDINELRAVTFKNKVVNEFLDNATKHFVIGSKGLGKTLLLTYKRSLLNEQYQGGDGRKQAAVQFVPEGRPYLDMMGDLPSLGKSQLQLMSELDSCKRMWSFAFRVAAVSHNPPAASSDEGEELKRFPASIRAMIQGRKAEPTVVLKELLATPFGELKQLLDRGEGFLEYKIRSMHSAVFMFVDKLDQALRRVPREGWIAMQAGMMEAAWDLMNTNAHVKIFATIREEAFSAYESDIKANLHGATTALRYSKRDLRDMLDKLTNFYEGITLRQFLSLDIVNSGQRARREAPFDFLCRHTLGRPRDLVIVSSELSRQRGSLDARTFQRVVEDSSAAMLVSNVFNEMRVFLELLADRDERGRFFALLPHNVLSSDDLIEVWCELHGLDREYYELHGHEAKGVYHPFRELYDCGLLGVVARDPSTGRRIQRFRRPRDPVGGSRRQLPSSSHYLLHPALTALVGQVAGGSGFVPFRHLVIGHGERWPSHYRRLLEVQRELLRGADRDDEDTEDAVYELLARFDEHVAEGESVEVARRWISSTGSFERLTRRLESLSWDDLHLALLELFPMVEDESERSMSAPRPRVEPGPGSGPQPVGPTERAEVAMLLVDIVRSTQLVEQEGDTMLIDYLREIHEQLTRDQSAVPRVIKVLGDGYLVAYDKVEAALSAARRLMAASSDPDALRLIVHCGRVRLGSADVFGAEVHRLFRLEKVAETGRVGPKGPITLPLPGRPLLSRAAVDALPTGTRETFEPVGRFRLKGFEEPAEVWVESSDT